MDFETVMKELEDLGTENMKKDILLMVQTNRFLAWLQAK